MNEALQQATVRREKVNTLYEKLYEDHADGTITEEWFMHMSHKYEVERYELKDKIVTLKQQLKDLTEQKRSADQFIAMVRKFSEIEMLTAPFLKELIDHIDVYETEGVGKNRTQRLKIYYNFVGYIEIPENLDNYVADTRQGVVAPYLYKNSINKRAGEACSFQKFSANLYLLVKCLLRKREVDFLRKSVKYCAKAQR